MKRKILSTLIISTFAFTSPHLAYSQLYSLVRNASGAADILGTPIPTGTLTETVTLDPLGLTIREVGTVFLPLTQAESTTRLYQQVGQDFPNPPRTAQADLTLRLDLSNQQDFRFDSGPTSLVWDNSLHTYTYSNRCFALLPTTLTYSLTTDGQTITGTLPVNFGFNLETGTALDTSGYPESLVLGPASIWPNTWFTLGEDPAGTKLVDTTADNGFHLVLSVVPEPSTLSLFAAGLLAFLFRRPRNL